MKKVTIYSSDTCPYCHMAMDYLKENSIEFEEKKQFIINNLNQKMMKLNTNQVTNDALNLLVQKTFDLFIKRIEYAQISKWMDDMLSNVKNKKQNATKSSSLNITDKNLLTKSQNPPFFKK